MYPRQELIVLARRKALLRDRICIDRDGVAAAAARLVEPIEMVDRGVAYWRRVSPMVKLAAIPLGLLMGRVLKRRARKLSAALRWGPVVFAAVRGFAKGHSFSRRA